MRIISCSIDVTKIDKTKLVKGEKGTYFNFDLVVNDEPDKYGNHASISLKQTKEEREGKEKKTYIGNGKVVWKGESRQQHSTVKPQPDGSDLPF